VAPPPFLKNDDDRAGKHMPWPPDQMIPAGCSAMELDHADDDPDRVHPRICFWIFGARVDIATAPCRGPKHPERRRD
jgi:hypothetical protein